MRIPNDQSNQKKLFNLGEMFLLAVLFLCFIDFKLYSLQFMVLAFCLFALLKGKLTITNSIVPMLLLTVSLAIFDPLSFHDSTTISKMVCWAPAFLLGYEMTRPSQLEPADIQIAEKKARALIALLVLGLLSHYTLNLLHNLGDEHLSRETLEFWSDKYMSATIQASLAVIPLGWCAATLVGAETQRKRILAILGIGIILYYNLTIATRILLLLTPLLCLLAILYTLLTKSADAKKRNVLIVVAIIVVVLFVLFALNAWGIRDTINESILFQRYDHEEDMSIAGDSRWELKREYLKLMPDHLWGGGHIMESVKGFAHDVFLDTYNEAGIFALIAVIAIIWDSVSKLRKLLLHPHIRHTTKLTFLCIYAAVYIEFLFEPIIAAEPWLLMLFCMLHGITCNLVTCTTSNNTQPESVK